MVASARMPRRTRLDSVSFDEVVAEQDPFGQGAGVFDLSGVTFVTPSALVQLASACYALARSGISPSIIVDETDLRSYLMRAGFVEAVEDVVDFDPPMPTFAAFSFDRLRGSNPVLIEVTRIEHGSDLPDILDRIVQVVRFRLKYPKFDAYDIATAVSEISQNTFDHNSDTFGFLAMQVYGRAENRFLEIGVADFGDGLMMTLRRNPTNASLTSDMAAIRCATELGSSEHEDPTRGTGLYHLLNIAYKHEGSVQIRSGQAKVRYRMDKQKFLGFNVPHVPGVQLAVTLPAKGKG